MALLNRKLKNKDADQLPLFEKPEKLVVDLDEDEDESQETFLHHGITLWVSDAVIMIIQHMQIFALILTMGERWGFPGDFVRNAAFTLFFNLDIWEFTKVFISKAYSGPINLDTFIDSDSVGINYSSYLIGWTVSIAVIGFGFLITYAVFLHRQPLYLLLHVARMKRVFSVLIQLVSLPVGITYARVFHCRSDNVWNVQNNLQCYSLEHWFYVAIAVIVGFLLFVAYPINMIRKIRGQVICCSEEKHEGYLLLKEAEYNQGLDILWAVGQFHLFSSFRRLWIYYRPIMIVLHFCLVSYFAVLLHFSENDNLRLSLAQKLLINIPILVFFFLVLFILFSSGLARPPVSAFRSFMAWFCWKGFSRLLHIIFNITPTWAVAKVFLVLLVIGVCFINNLGGGIGALLSLLCLIMVRSPPFRVTSFNFMILFCLFINICNAYVGTMVGMFNANEIVNAIYAPPIPEIILRWINIAWIIGAIFWIIYLLARYSGTLFPKRPLWPTFVTNGKSNMNEETLKYMRAVLHGRHTLEKALSTPPMFAPVHELERQIHIINAYCREAEFLDDPTFDSLWDLLDELIEAHRNLSPQSLFSLSAKKSVRETAKELMRLVPQMRKRLDQRECDFILMDPMKKRMLLKMFVLGVFVNGCKDKVKQDVENKVYTALKEAENLKASSSTYGSSVRFDWDSMVDMAGPFPPFDMMRTASSTGSRPDTSVSISSRPGSVEKFLHAVEDWEEGQVSARKNRFSTSSMPLIAERPTPEASLGSTASIPGQVNLDDDEVKRRPASGGRPSLGRQRISNGSNSSFALIGDSSATEQPSTSGSQSSLRSTDDRKPLIS